MQAYAAEISLSYFIFSRFMHIFAASIGFAICAHFSSFVTFMCARPQLLVIFRFFIWLFIPPRATIRAFYITSTSNTIYLSFPHYLARQEIYILLGEF